VKSLWIWYIPLFFLPSFGLSFRTAFGTLELSDFVMIPFLPLILLAPKIRGPTLRGEVKKLGLMFIVWAGASILWIDLFYHYDDLRPVLMFSLLKLAKFSLYCTAGLMVSRSLVNQKMFNKYHFMLAIAGAVTGLSLAATTAVSRRFPSAEGFRATNLISVGMAILLCYTFVLYVRGYGTRAWQKVAMVALGIMVLGTTFSGGRGGWLATLAGMSYALFHVRIRLRTGLVAASLTLGLLGLYAMNPAFKHQIDRTLFPDEKYLETYKMGVAGVDDGGRITTWLNEAAKIFYSPIFGTGFYHRGPQTQLWATGSHNFWLQMFLETGLVGGTLVLFVFFLLWRHAELFKKEDVNISLALKSALVAAFVGGLSGEYFYGGFTLFTLFLIYAPVGSMHRSHDQPEPTGSGV